MTALDGCLRQGLNKEDRAARFCQFHTGCCCSLRDVLHVRNDQCAVGLSAHAQRPAALRIVGAKTCSCRVLLRFLRGVHEDIRRDEMIIDLMVVEFDGGFLQIHELTGPVRLRVVEDGGRDDGLSAADQRADPVHVFHQRAEVTVLGIVSVCVEVRRAVRIRIFLRRKGVRDIVVDAADHQVVCEVFLEAHALGPAVVAEDLTHRVAVL